LDGFNVQHSIHRITKELFERLGQPARAWIFQANPTMYDMRGALKALKTDTFFVSRYEDEIGPGDRVYLWESGKNAGIVGVAEIIEKPRLRLDPPESLRFKLDREKFEGDQVRALVRLLRCVDPSVSRDQILALPALSNLSILRQPQGSNFKVTPAEAEAIEQLLSQKMESSQLMENQEQPTESRFAQLCRETFLPESFYVDCERLLEGQKQIILQGAPGTGKTFVAEKLATWWAGAPERTQTVQFHESYGYEDFVHGIKPQYDSDKDRTLFRPIPGIFVVFCEVARGNGENRYVLVIDEINRAKVSRVFGELLYLLEYRNKSVLIQSGEKFSIPPKVYIIGTMNTADKSIALVDYALRRRFAFATLRSVEGDKSIVLRPWLEANGIANADHVDRLFVTLNKLIAAKDEALMIGHSYFMSAEAVAKKRFTDDLLRFIWRYRIMPLAAEYEYELSAAQIEEKYGLAAVTRLAGLK
jgi:5-methylcytosine-specific restriction protein B